MERKTKVKDLLYTKEQLEKYIDSLERFTSVTCSIDDMLSQTFKDLNIERVSYFDLNGAANYLRDYLKLVESVINNAEVDWPLK